MKISALTSTQVWAASARSLTNFGSGALAPQSTVNTALAGAATVDLRTSSGIVASMTVSAITGAGATGSISIVSNDGTSQIQMAATAASPGAVIAFSTLSTNAVGPRVQNNDATHAGSYQVIAFSFTQ